MMSPEARYGYQRFAFLGQSAEKLPAAGTLTTTSRSQIGVRELNRSLGDA